MDIKGIYTANSMRYENGDVLYARCGKSGIMLPKISLGMWHNFGSTEPYSRCREIAHYAFDNGITHFDLANNYGPPYGTAEETFGQLMDDDFRPYRDEMFISTKAGFDMWQGPYGEFGSRKYLIASLNQSLKRMRLDYVDLFYSHRFDPITPIEETLQAMVDIVRMGKALYLGISNWPLEPLKKAVEYLKEQHTPLLIYQGRLNLLNREPVEEGILEFCQEQGIGFIAYSPLAQGLLTDKYLNGIPADSRMAQEKFLHASDRTPQLIDYLHQLQADAQNNGRTIAQQALSWVLNQQGVTSVIVGAHSVEQLQMNLQTIIKNY